MFSHALMHVLLRGHEGGGPLLSFSEVGDLIKEDLRNTYPDGWVRPEVHSPDQREGDIAHIPLFPNPAYGEGRSGGKKPKRREKERGRTSARNSKPNPRRLNLSFKKRCPSSHACKKTISDKFVLRESRPQKLQASGQRWRQSRIVDKKTLYGLLPSAHGGGFSFMFNDFPSGTLRSDEKYQQTRPLKRPCRKYS